MDQEDLEDKLNSVLNALERIADALETHTKLRRCLAKKNDIRCRKYLGHDNGPDGHGHHGVGLIDGSPRWVTWISGRDMEKWAVQDEDELI